MRRWLVFLLGLSLPILSLLFLASPGKSALSGWDNVYLDNYPWDFQSQPKHLFIGTGCWTWTVEAYMPKGSHQATSSQRATLHAALNNVLAEQAPDIADRFYAFGKPDVDFDRHLMSIYQAVRQGNVKSIVYINNPGSLQAFTRPANAAAAADVLDAIERDYPQLAKDARIYRAALQASQGFAKSHEPAKPGKSDIEIWAKGVTARWQGVLQSLNVTPFERLRNQEQSNALLADVRNNYDNPVTCATPERALLPADLFWKGAGGDEVWQAWLRLAAGLAQAHGIPFVYYVPPHLNLPAQRYEADFKPYFADRVASVLKDIPTARLIDQSVEHGLSACDQVYDSEHLFGAGYLFNYVGKAKQSRLLLGELARQGLLAADNQRFAPPTRFEASLPAATPHLAILSDAATLAVQEDLIRFGEWKLSRPMAEASP